MRLPAQERLGPQGREQIDGFEHVGLALGVVADEDVQARREIHVLSRVIAEIAETQVGDMHALEVPSFAREGKRGLSRDGIAGDSGRRVSRKRGPAAVPRRWLADDFVGTMPFPWRGSATVPVATRRRALSSERRGFGLTGR